MRTPKNLLKFWMEKNPGLLPENGPSWILKLLKEYPNLIDTLNQPDINVKLNFNNENGEIRKALNDFIWNRFDVKCNNLFFINEKIIYFDGIPTKELNLEYLISNTETLGIKSFNEYLLMVQKKLNSYVSEISTVKIRRWENGIEY